jgi:hypothetical protein
VLRLLPPCLFETRNFVAISTTFLSTFSSASTFRTVVLCNRHPLFSPPSFLTLHTSLSFFFFAPTFYSILSPPSPLSSSHSRRSPKTPRTVFSRIAMSHRSPSSLDPIFVVGILLRNPPTCIRLSIRRHPFLNSFPLRSAAFAYSPLPLPSARVGVGVRVLP